MKLINQKTAEKDGGIVYDIQLHNCGFYEDLHTKIPTYRPLGRDDYQIIFVLNGGVECKISDQKLIVQKDNLIFIPPHKCQNYTYLPGKNTSYCWLHFNGRIMDKILKVFPLSYAVYKMNDISRCAPQLERIRKIALKDEPGCEFAVNAMLQQFLISLWQEIFRQKSASPIEKKLFKSIRMIDEYPERQTDFSQLARECRISEYHLIRIFKEKTGLTPVQYQIRSRIHKAKLLLADTDTTVCEIAYLCGFNDPLYFSRLFKSKVGLSPSQFRKESIPAR